MHEFPILKGQRGAFYSVRLEVGGVREPHWHPNAWEFDYCISGLGRMTVLAPQGQAETFEVNPGDIAFVPQGHFHYFENIGQEPLYFIVAFNCEQGEAEDDIGVASTIGVLPHSILAKIFNVPEATFSNFAHIKDRLVMVSKSEKT
jgi:oxalate decarboxylase